MKSRWLVLGLIGCFLVLTQVVSGEEGGKTAKLLLCQIHRGGGAKTFPDNSLESFLWCWGNGVTPEADARLTKDGVAIAFHDGTLKRVVRGIPSEWEGRKIADMEWSELRDLDIGSYIDKKFASSRIVQMETVFAAMKGRPERLLYLDEKGAPPEMMAEMSARFGVQEQVYYTSSNYALLPRWKKMAPKGKTMLWMGGGAKNNSSAEIERTEKLLGERLAALEKAGFNGVDIVQIHVRTDFSKPDPFCPSSAFMKKAGELLHKHGIIFQSLSWTEGANPKTYQKLWELGVDTFATDYPFEFIEAMKSLK